MSADLVQPATAEEEGFLLDVISSKQRYSRPVMPGYFHTGLHQRQSGNQFYHRNGVRV